MNRRMVRRLAVLSLAVALSAAAAMPVYADDASGAAEETIAQNVPIGSVSIGNGSYFELKQANLLQGDDGKIVTFTVSLTNGSDKEIQFIDYWLRLQNKSATLFNPVMMPQDKDKNIVSARGSIDLHFYAKVNDATSLSDLTVSFVRWDFSVEGYERKLGSISIPQDYNTETPVGTKRLIPVGGTTVKSSVNRAVVNQNDDYYLTNVYFSLENIGLKSAAVPNYNYAIQTSEGFLYPLDASAKDLSIAPKVKRELQLNAQIPRSVDAGGWKLVVTQTDTGLKLDLPIATYVLPPVSAEDPTTSTDNTRDVDVNGTIVKASIARFSVGKNDKSYMTSVFFNFKNAGTKAVAIPAYQFVLRTKDGLAYPLAAPGLDKLTVNPQESKEVQLSVNIPIAVNIDNLELQMIQPAAQGSDPRFNYPVATFKVPKQTTTNDISIGIEYPFTNAVGSYTAKLTSVQRLPWEDQDILSASILLGNKGKSSLSIPKLSAYFLLDGNVRVDANLMQTDNAISVPGKASIGYTALAKIPYTSAFTDLKLVLQEKPVGDESPATLVEFKHNKDLLAVPVIAKGEAYQLQSVGKAAELRLTNVHTYAGTEDDLFYAEMDMKNLEKRSTSANNMFGYFKTPDDMYFPVTLSSVTGKIAPSGKAVVAVWGTVPKGITLANLDLMIGEAAKTSGDKVDAYMHVVDMKLPDEVIATKTSLSDIAVGPYKLSFDKVMTKFTDATQFDFSAQYTLTKSASMQLPEVKHKLLIEITDSEDSFTQAYNLELGTGGPVLELASKKSLTIANLKTNNVINKMNSRSSYKLNIYDEFEGHRMLLASQSFTWFAPVT